MLIISYYWPPSGGAGVQRWLKFAKYLPQFGIEPIVLTVDPKYASYPQKDESLLAEAAPITTFRTKSLEVYNLYSSLKKNKEIPYGGFSNEGSPSLFQKMSRFVRGNFFIPDPRKSWNRFAYNQAVKIIQIHNIDTVITTSPPHSSQLIGLKLKQNGIVKQWIADFRDPWTDIYFYDKFYPTSLARKIDSNYERKVVTQSDELITVSDSIKQVLEKRYSLKKSIQVIANGFDAADFPQSILSLSKTQEMVYTGTLSNDYPLDEVVALAKNNPSLKFRFIGNVTPQFIQMVEKAGLNAQFVFENAVSHSEIIPKMSQAGILLLLIPQVENNEGILTGKLFEYLGAQRPILAIGPALGDAKEIVESSKAGKYFSYKQALSITTEDIEMLLEHQVSGNADQFSRQNLTGQLSKLIAVK